jgi:hypothetical protein
MIKLVPVSLKVQYDLDHSAQAMFTDCNRTAAGDEVSHGRLRQGACLRAA